MLLGIRNVIILYYKSFWFNWFLFWFFWIGCWRVDVFFKMCWFFFFVFCFEEIFIYKLCFLLWNWVRKGGFFIVGWLNSFMVLIDLFVFFKFLVFFEFFRIVKDEVFYSCVFFVIEFMIKSCENKRYFVLVRRKSV